MQEKDDNLLVGERIRTIREGFHMSREKFSEMIDISDVFLGQIERGECSLSLKTLRRIISFTGVSADFILFGERKNNNTIMKINNILNKADEKTVNYIYELIRASYSYLKNHDTKT